MPGSPFSSLSPDDAEVAVRSFPRRFREAASAAAVTLDDEPDEADVDEVANRPGVDGRSGLDHVATAAARLDAACRALRTAVVSPTARIDHTLLEDAPPASVPDHSGHLEAELDGLERAASALAEVTGAADANQWLATRPTTASGSASPLALLQATVGVVLDHLRALERVLREVRGRPA